LRRTAAPLVAACLVIVGCTHEDREPGLFDNLPRPTARSTSLPRPPQLPRTNPDLPVAGEAVWTSADGLNVQVRYAVHAVRRIDRATVLDWSVTPLRGFNLLPGDAVPASIDLGLTRRGTGGVNVTLIDAQNQAVYRPLRRARGSESCLCTPIEQAQQRLRVGFTTVLQIAFPELPTALRTVDVNVATVPQFWRVPVTPIGQVPVADGPTDLTRRAADELWLERSDMFRFGPSEQVLRVQVHRVTASTTFTTLEWAIVSVTGGDGVGAASVPPFAGRDAARLFVQNPVSASGPVLRVADVGQTLRPRVMTNRLASGESHECVCTDLRAWTAVLRRPDKVATAVTSYPALPVGTPRVDVVFEGLRPMAVTVTAALDGTHSTAEPVAAGARFWPARSDPHPGWQTGDWPTPVPSRAQVERYSAVVDRLVG
jgi:hypothetical protein